MIRLLFFSLAVFALEQYTPTPAVWTTFQTKAIKPTGYNAAHDPNGVLWIKSADWDASKWDGTIYNPSKMTKAAFGSAICPSGDRIRGIREVFYANKPFADIVNPTKAEVDNWHRIALNHVRAMVGYTSPDRQVQPDHCMFARAQWGQERKYTTKWDAKYPGTLGSAYGPCVGGTNAHCGATFIPNAADQAPYLPAGHPPCTLVAGAEGVFNSPKSDIPWSIKWSRALCSALGTEGFWGGHVGPFFHRQKFGFAFYDTGIMANLRAKWTGTLMPSLYCNPAGTGCNPVESD